MGDGTSDLVKREEGWASDVQRREAEDMALASAAYHAAFEDADQCIRACDPRVILSKARAKLRKS